jgi:hypothetical protein
LRDLHNLLPRHSSCPNLSFPRRRKSRLINLFQTPAFETVSQYYGIGAITCDDANSQVTTSAFISALK